MKIYTKTGDKGETSLYGGQRISKTSARIEVIGNIDELNATLGVVVAKLAQKKFKTVVDLLTKIQSDLFVLGADMATPASANSKLKILRVNSEMTSLLEQEIDSYSTQLAPMRNFIIPGGSEVGAVLHQARSICRRAERSVVYAKQSEKVNDNCQIYLNRLSDLLFVLARFVNTKMQISEQAWIT